ncbi:peptidylprolyl isomerase [Streptomyces sp. NBC_00038]|uniref:peptidylprolyl isomerase n=1 Tax=Streptomyces sp. NBC_00038 TaxID=2903615 RepID=UPI002256E526|nr:peptidylprolyl isomerase [Streptomyces sp. NBC_00038]MCX5559150.1 peptidylprolyl isomerase [Streptomyces sp. NBC_00038]
MPIRKWSGKLRANVRPKNRVAAAATMALAVTGIGSALTWMSVSLTTADSDAKPQASCSYTPTERGKTSGIPAFDAEKAARPLTATLVTNRGDVTLKALTGDAPCASNSFSFLARKGYFDGSECHRVTTQGIYVLECGDAKGDGKADPGYYFADENLDGADYPAGTVAMAKVEPGRNGSQFFISYADPDVAMSPLWTPFAKVVGGMDVLQKIGEAGTSDGSTDGRPQKPVVIESVVLR